MSLEEFSLLRLACDTHHITQLTPASLAMTNTPEDLNEPTAPRILVIARPSIR